MEITLGHKYRLHATTKHSTRVCVSIRLRILWILNEELVEYSILNLSDAYSRQTDSFQECNSGQIHSQCVHNLSLCLCIAIAVITIIICQSVYASPQIYAIASTV